MVYPVHLLTKSPGIGIWMLYHAMHSYIGFYVTAPPLPCLEIILLPSESDSFGKYSLTRCENFVIHTCKFTEPGCSLKMINKSYLTCSFPLVGLVNVMRLRTLFEESASFYIVMLPFIRAQKPTAWSRWLEKGWQRSRMPSTNAPPTYQNSSRNRAKKMTLKTDFYRKILLLKMKTIVL